MDEYACIYWAAACLAFWAGRRCCNVSSAQFADAVNMVCDGAGLTVPQEVLFKRIIHKMTGGEDVE